MTGEMASVQRDVVEPVAVADDSVGPLSLDECIDIALKKNRFRPAARFAVEIAEAQHKQALSGYWPRMKLSAAWTRLDEDPNFVFPSFSMELPAMSMAGFNVQLPPIAVPEQD
ncbi:MAG: TolC family protein, partial [Candidatus Latescibacteria bacterium]|nr:TolC family protein [Candidatus Latescibacterota bacterium]